MQCVSGPLLGYLVLYGIHLFYIVSSITLLLSNLEIVMMTL